MALAKNSYYYNLVYKKDKNKDIDDQPIIRTKKEQLEYEEKLNKIREMERKLFSDLKTKMENK